MAGQPPAREVARGVGENADDQDPVERGRAVEHSLLDLVAQRQGGDEKQHGEPELDKRRDS